MHAGVAPARRIEQQRGEGCFLAQVEQDDDGRTLTPAVQPTVLCRNHRTLPLALRRKQ